MKRFLYEIDCDGVHVQGIPFMPKVLAEKQACVMNKAEVKKYGHRVVKYSVSKTSLVVGDGSPHGCESWDDYCEKRGLI